MISDNPSLETNNFEYGNPSILEVEARESEVHS